MAIKGVLIGDKRIINWSKDLNLHINDATHITEVYIKSLLLNRL